MHKLMAGALSAGLLSTSAHAAAPSAHLEGGEAILLLAHIDVVEAKREDWVRDPFTLIEENGYLYGRGTLDRPLASKQIAPVGPHVPPV